MRKLIRNILMILVIVMICSGCDKKVEFNDYVSHLNDSMNSVKTITNNIKAYDSNILVYEYNNQFVFLENGNAEETKTVTSLTASFELETKTDKNTIENVERNKLLNINLKNDLLSNLKMESDKLSFNLTQENIKLVFNFNDFDITGDAKCEFNFNDKKIDNIKISFVTSSNKNVEVTISYQY